MRSFMGWPRGAFLRAATMSLCVSSVLATAARAQGPFVVEALGEGVHLFRVPYDALPYVNSLVVEREDGLLVVAAQPSPAAARKLLAAIDARLSKPVRYLALPHSHAEVAGGASAFGSDVLVIASLPCRSALEDVAYDFGAEGRARSADPEAWREPSRRLPVLVLEARSALADPLNPVELLPFGHSHSPGDLLVRVPSQDVFYVGALLFPEGRPYASDARVGSWMSALNHLVRQAPRVMIPLRGPVVNVAAVREQRNAFAWMRGQVEFGLGKRWPSEQIRDWILAEPGTADRFTLDSPFLASFIDEAIAQATADRNKMIRP